MGDRRGRGRRRPGAHTGSYRTFAAGPYLTAAAMAWFWDAYLPDKAQRDEGEAYGRRLTAAGVRVTSARYNGTLHDFMMLNPVRGTAATTAAVEQAIHIIRKALSLQEQRK